MAKSSWYQAVFRFLRNVSKTLFGGWSLERKSLLFLGVALVLPIGLSFWFVLQVLADRLVMEKTRQAARDYARTAIGFQHLGNDQSVTAFPDTASGSLFTPDANEILRTELIDNPEYAKPEFVMLEESENYNQFKGTRKYKTERELELLEDLNEQYREQLAKLESAESEAVQIAMQNVAPEDETGPSSDTVGVLPPEKIDELFETYEPIRNLRKSLDLLYRDDGPYFPSGDELIRLVGNGIIQETPSGGWYVYYHSINFREKCLGCHSRHQQSDAPNIPFRTVKVMIPFAQTQVASTTTLAIMITVAMVTVATTLLVVHWVFRRLVLNPMNHLRTVSEEISRGNLDLRAELETGDEFSELGDAFNRMLINLSDDREKLRSLNVELDEKVDQLAQANFNLYEANRLKSDFLANMSHELRTPLNSIIGFSDVIREIDSLSDKQKKYADNIQSSGKVLLDMINEILDLAKIEAGKMQVSPSSFDLRELISSQCDALRPLVDEKNVELRKEFPDGDSMEAFQDRAKLQQILTNLLSNAIKFTPDGGMITVRAGEDGVSQDRILIIEVEDTGVGIPESDFEIIFEKFRQSNEVLQNDGLTRQYAGTGLGLSIVKELCKLLGGEIQLSSQLCVGSMFRVIIPAEFQAGELHAVSEQEKQ